MPSKASATAIVVAAGRASRFGGGVAKQFLELAGRSVVEVAVCALAGRPGIDGAIVVLSPEEMDGPRHRQLAAIDAVTAVIAGGETRAASVAHGLAATATSHVLVHDAARPLVSGSVVDAVLSATIQHGAAVPVIAVRDTVKSDDGSGFVATTIDRAPLRLAQTPQGARTDWLIAALADARRAGVEVTDESQALELAGRRVALVTGDPANIKITTAEDLADARRRIGDEPVMELRAGTGYDIHRFDRDRPLFLGGVKFPGEPGLSGHSDADVVLHAAMDAVLGAAALPDIGFHFPPGDPRFAGADSRALAREVARMLAERAATIVNVDLTVLAERPKIGPHVAAMRAEIAGAFEIDPSRVGLKATTLEGLGALGRGDGIACQAVALVRLPRIGS